MRIGLHHHLDYTVCLLSSSYFGLLRPALRARPLLGLPGSVSVYGISREMGQA